MISSSRPNQCGVAEAHGRDCGCVSFAIESFGLRLGVTVFNRALVPEVVRFLPPERRLIEFNNLDGEFVLDRIHEDLDGTGPSTWYRAYVNGVSKARSRRRDHAASLLERVIRIHIAQHTRAWVFVHAGVVGWRGRAIMLPGKGRSGKSTLVTALVHAGATYYSDEYAILDETGLVYSYPKLVNLREGPFGHKQWLDLTSRAPAGGWRNASLPAGLIAALRYDAQTGWDVSPMSNAQTVQFMSEHSWSVVDRPDKTFSALACATQDAITVRGTRDDIDAAAGRLLALCNWE